MGNFTLSAIFLFRWYYYRGGNYSAWSERDFSALEFVILSVITLGVLFFAYYKVTRLIESRTRPSAKAIKATEPLSGIHRSLLSEKSDYYNKLSKTDKELFEKRVRHYMSTKMFTTEDGYAITDEMKVMISAAACQLTFGLPLSGNSTYTHVLIMPNAAMEPKSASKSNTIVVPWNEFVQGYAQSDDGQNEGLKVMAMALIRDNRLQSKGFKFFAEKKYSKWEKIASQEADTFMSGMFQGMANDERLGDEYFALAVVYFFELPVAFKHKYPVLFDTLADLLGQDTVKRTIVK